MTDLAVGTILNDRYQLEESSGGAAWVSCTGPTTHCSTGT